jgi:hypothetical protein
VKKSWVLAAALFIVLVIIGASVSRNKQAVAPPAASAPAANIQGQLSPEQLAAIEAAKAKWARNQVAAEAAAQSATRLTARREYASQLERHLLSIGIDARVRAVGKQQDTLRISWAAMSRPVVYNMMTSAGMQSEVPTLGFTQVILTDDGSFSGAQVETWRYRWDGSAWQSR